MHNEIAKFNEFSLSGTIHCCSWLTYDNMIPYSSRDVTLDFYIKELTLLRGTDDNDDDATTGYNKQQFTHSLSGSSGCSRLFGQLSL